MSTIPIPKGYDVYWEKWIDAFEDEDPSLDDASLDEEDELTEDEAQLIERSILDSSVLRIKSVITPFGILPITEQTKASSSFKLWVGHCNFKLTEDFYKVIGQFRGVETLDILTPYRFRIAIGKMFVDRQIMKSLRDRMVAHVAGKLNHDK